MRIASQQTECDYRCHETQRQHQLNKCYALYPVGVQLGLGGSNENYLGTKSNGVRGPTKLKDYRADAAESWPSHFDVGELNKCYADSSWGCG